MNFKRQIDRLKFKMDPIICFYYSKMILIAASLIAAIGGRYFVFW